MSKKQNLNEEIIRSLSGDQNWLSIPRTYIDLMGSLNGGLMLSQVIYWSNKGSRVDGYFWKSYKNWTEETSLSKHQVFQQIKIMKENKFLQTKVLRVGGNPTLHYKFLFSEFEQWLVKKFNERKLNNLTNDSKEIELSNSTSNTTSTTAANVKANKTVTNKSNPIIKSKAARGKCKNPKFNLSKFCKEEAPGLEAKLFPSNLRWTDNQVGFLRNSLNGQGRDINYINNKAALANARSTVNGGWWRYFQRAVLEDFSAEFTYKPAITGQIKSKYAGVRVRHKGAEHVLSSLGTLSLAGGVVAAGEVAQAISSGALEVL